MSSSRGHRKPVFGNLCREIATLEAVGFYRFLPKLLGVHIAIRIGGTPILSVLSLCVYGVLRYGKGMFILVTSEICNVQNPHNLAGDKYKFSRGCCLSCDHGLFLVHYLPGT